MESRPSTRLTNSNPTSSSSILAVQRCMESKLPAAIRDKRLVTKILFLTEHRSVEIIQEALRISTNGYIVRSDAIELLVAIEAIQGNRIFLRKTLKTQTTEASKP